MAVITLETDNTTLQAQLQGMRQQKQQLETMLLFGKSVHLTCICHPPTPVIVYAYILFAYGIVCTWSGLSHGVFVCGLPSVLCSLKLLLLVLIILHHMLSSFVFPTLLLSGGNDTFNLKSAPVMVAQVAATGTALSLQDFNVMMIF